MSNIIEYDDIIMKDSFDTGYRNFFSSNFKNYVHKRNYLDMLNNSNLSLVNTRIENFKLINKDFKKIEKTFNDNNENINNTKKGGLLKEIDDSFFTDINKTKKNFIVKSKLEYDEEKEKKWVENYYRIKNAKLNKLRFGTE